jgi:hypothetical protein
MADLKELHVCLEFCLKLKKAATEIYKMAENAFGNETHRCSEIYEWLAWTLWSPLDITQ